jgi:hypothetical protein
LFVGPGRSVAIETAILENSAAIGKAAGPDGAPTVAAPAKYLGTGGMIADSSIFTDDALFRCPGKYWFIEDVWLSYFAAAVHGWRLYRSHAEIGLMLDDLGQTRRLSELKNAFFRHLNKDPRWGDPGNANTGRLVPAQPRRPAEQRTRESAQHG